VSTVPRVTTHLNKLRAALVTGSGSGTQTWASTFYIDVICVTLGPEGCMIYDKGSTHRVPELSSSEKLT
jgi:hypothetical protein